ncbi:MAG: ABC transporter ATP-binding protein [Cucumibacter sp.]
MPHISTERLSVTFRIYGANSRSLKKQIVKQATGGRLVPGADDTITVRALDEVSLEVEHGDRVGIVGHNGAGKSTLLKALAGIYKPTGGSIAIRGKVGALLDPAAGLDPDATGIENIYLRGYILGMKRAEIEERIEDIRSFTELGDYLDLPLRTYSAGMFARLAFGISTSIRPDILLLDEGIGAGDGIFFDKMQDRLGAVVERVGILLLASHDKVLVERFCNRVLRLEHGRLVEFTGRGTVRDALAEAAVRTRTPPPAPSKPGGSE